MSPARSLVVHTGALGDFLLACPAIARVAEAGRVVLAGSPERHALAVAAGIAEKAVPLDALHLHEALGGSETAPRFRDALQGYTRAVIWMRDPGDILKNAFQAAGIPHVIAAPGLPHADWPGHAAAYYCASIKVAENPEFTLKIPPMPGLHTVIAPGSGASAKNYPLQHFQTIARALEVKKHRVTWLLGPADDGIELPPDANVLRTPDLTHLAAQLAAAHLYIGNDTGPTHLAALTGCPTLALFGKTNPDTWRPLGPHTQILRSPAQGTWPSPTEVLAKAHAFT